MKNLKFISALVVVIALASCSSCSSDDNKAVDTEKPTLSIVAPTDGKVFHAGDDIHVEADFYDNEELASYKIDIHWAGDGHGHKPANVSEDDHVRWSYEKTGELSGKNANIHIHTDKIPANVEEGEYHFGIYVIDKAGNQDVKWVEIDIHNHGDGGHDHDDDDDDHDHDHDH